MYTYIILKEHEEKKLSDFSFLFRSFEERGIVGISNETDGATLKKQINNFLSMHVATEWQLIIVDGDTVYSKDSPYCDEKISKFVDELFIPEEESYFYKRNIHTYEPQRIFLLSLKKAMFISNKESIMLYSGFYESYLPSCRFLVLNVEEEFLNKKIIFKLMCTTLILIINQWMDFNFERQYLYQIDWEIDEKSAREYLGDLVNNHSKILEMLNDKFYDEQDDDKNVFFEPMEPIVNLGESEKIPEFKKHSFPFFRRPQKDEAFWWKKDNGMVIEGIKKLLEFPVGRWEKEIAEEKRAFLNDLSIESSRRVELTRTARYDLHKKKEKSAEAIFSIQINGEQKKDLVKKVLEQEENMELLINTRMTVQSFFRPLFEILGGILLVVFMNVQFLQNSIPFLVIIFFLILLLVMEVHLNRERTVKRNKINRYIEEINKTLRLEDMNYRKILGKIILHKKYSLFEQMQEKLDREKNEEKKLLELHRKKLAICEQNDQKLIWTLGIMPDKHREKNQNLIINFLDSPEKCEYYYYPFYTSCHLNTIIDKGIPVILPFPFIRKFSINKSCLPAEPKEKIDDVSRKNSENDIENG